MSVANLRVC